MTFKDFFDSMTDMDKSLDAEFVRRNYNLYTKQLGLSTPTEEKVSITFSTNPYPIPNSYMGIKEINGFTQVGNAYATTYTTDSFYVRNDRNIVFSSVPTSAVDCMVYRFSTELADSDPTTAMTIPDTYIPSAMSFILMKMYEQKKDFELMAYYKKEYRLQMRQAQACELSANMTLSGNLTNQ
jgi:hypothetical protein